MNGLYALKPWYARRLVPVVDQLERHRVTPDAVSAAGVLCGAAAGAALALLPAGAVAAGCIAALAGGRLACANMDGTLARRCGGSAFGGVVNELGDRGADLALLAGFAAPLGWPVAALLLAATLPSWASLAVAANGGGRANGGPLGKTERCAGAVVAAATGWYAPVALVIGAGSVVTAVLRLARGRAALRAVSR